MPFESSTLCARTTAGEAELATPSQGLSLGQRRVLTLLESPSAVEELAEKHRLEPEKLARDLTRLAELRLVRLQGPGIGARASAVEPSATVTPAMAPVVIGRSSRRTPVMPLAVGTTAVLLAAGIWYGTRPQPSTPVTVQPVAAAPVPVAAPVPGIIAPPPASARSTLDAVPAVATVLRGKAAMPEARPEIHPGLVASAQNRVVAAPVESRPVPDRTTTATNFLPPALVAAPVAAPVATPAPAAATPSPASASPAPVDPAPAPARTATDATLPLQMASISPAAVAPRPKVVHELKALSREPPDFPREAEGLKSGLVNARILIDGRGNVSSVEILSSQPPKVFDKAARRALLRWQFEPPPGGQTASLDVDVKFKSD